MKNPFEYPAPSYYPVATLAAGTVEDQMPIVREADAAKLAEIIAWPETGATVRKAAAARLRKLDRAAPRKDPNAPPVPGHVVSMQTAADPARSVAVCECGWRHEVPWGEYEAQDAAIAAHWASVSGGG